MRFTHGLCIVCNKDSFKEEEILAFRRKNSGIERIDLEGQEPWCGIIVVCLDCTNKISFALKKVVEEETNEWKGYPRWK